MSGADAEPGPALQRVVVVVPAKDEAELLPGCLDALAAAAVRSPVPVTVVVAVESSGPGGAGTLAVVTARPDVLAVPLPHAVVGQARHAGAVAGLRQVGALDEDRRTADAGRTWVATTDADSVVPPDWLTTQVRLARAGADLVLGTVQLPATACDPVAAAWRQRYGEQVRTDDHPHVHGANLGVRASAYLDCGGFPAVSAHEDVLLAAAVRRLPGTRCLTTTAIPVTTSDRRLGRTPDGVAADLRRLATG